MEYCFQMISLLRAAKGVSAGVWEWFVGVFTTQLFSGQIFGLTLMQPFLAADSSNRDEHAQEHICSGFFWYLRSFLVNPWFWCCL